MQLIHAFNHSKGKFKYYGQWLDGNKPPTFQEKLKAQIDICLAEKPSSMEAFLQAMEAAGFEVKHGRGGVISFRAEGQERFTRLRSSTQSTAGNIMWSIRPILNYTGRHRLLSNVFFPGRSSRKWTH